MIKMKKRQTEKDSALQVSRISGHLFTLAFLSQKKIKHPKAFTLIEALIIVAILGTLLTLLVPNINSLILKGKNTKAASDIASISRKIEDYFLDNGNYPETLTDIGIVDLQDPWKNPYQYLVIFGKKKNEVDGKWRKDRFLVPLNSDFDLYSSGKDEKSTPPLTAKDSWDDTVRANNGEFIGLGSKY
jgi:general secretion pathway protein G